MTSLTTLTLKAALDGLADKSFSSEELTRAHMQAVEAARPARAAFRVIPVSLVMTIRPPSARRRSFGPGGGRSSAPGPDRRPR